MLDHLFQSVAQKVLADGHLACFGSKIKRERNPRGRVLTPLSIFRDANTGAGQDLTDLAAAVQLRLRVAVGGCKHCSDAAVS